ncbi:MAG: M14 family metallopeptidase [Candidatus Paceibacterota bacterium]|jgi:hypothetical protein
MKKSTIGVLVIVIIIIIIGVYYFTSHSSNLSPATPGQATTTAETASSSDQAVAPVDKTKTVIGQSVEKRDITAYHYGNGSAELLFIGGVHGGYEWNTTLVAYKLMDYLKANPDAIPQNVKITVIPVLNPDGLNKVVGTTGQFTAGDVSASEETVIDGRFNANNVDLNRNFDCHWQPTGTWQKMTVSGGSQAFSEPESQALKNYAETNKPVAVVVWYSAAGGVFASQCDNGILPGTKELMSSYSAASGYKAYDSFDFYQTTGDLADWLAKQNIPAINVILSAHNDTEWTKNLAGIQALLTHYAK